MSIKVRSLSFSWNLCRRLKDEVLCEQGYGVGSEALVALAIALVWVVAWFTAKWIARRRRVWWMAVLGGLSGWLLAVLTGVGLGFWQKQGGTLASPAVLGSGIWFGGFAAIWSAVRALKYRPRLNLYHADDDASRARYD